MPISSIKFFYMNLAKLWANSRLFVSVFCRELIKLIILLISTRLTNMTVNCVSCHQSINLYLYSATSQPKWPGPEVDYRLWPVEVKETTNNAERKKKSERYSFTAQTHVCKTSPVQQGALHCSCILSELQLSDPPTPPHPHRHRHSLYHEMTPHIWMSSDCCVFKLFIEHLQWHSGPQRGARAASWKELRCLPSVLCEPRKTVSRGGLQERPSVALSPVCLRLLFQVPAEVVPLSVAHLSTSGCTDCVWLFQNEKMRHFNKTHTAGAQPEERSAVTPPRGSLSPQHTQADSSAATSSSNCCLF